MMQRCFRLKVYADGFHKIVVKKETHVQRKDKQDTVIEKCKASTD